MLPLRLNASMENILTKHGARKVPLSRMLSQSAQQCYLLQAAKLHFLALASLANWMKHATTYPQESKTARKLPKVYAAKKRSV